MYPTAKQPRRSTPRCLAARSGASIRRVRGRRPSSHSTGVEGNLNVDRSIQLGPSGHLRCTQNTSHSAAEGGTRISVLRVPPRSATDTVHNSSALPLQLNTSALIPGGLAQPSPSPIRHRLHRLHRRLLHAVLHAVLLHVCRVKRGRCSLGDVVRGLLYYPLADGAGRGGPRWPAAGRGRRPPCA